VNGAPATVGVTEAGTIVHVGGAPVPHVRFTALLYPFAACSRPLMVPFWFACADTDGLLIAIVYVGTGAVTVRLTLCVFAAGAPAVFAEIVIAVVAIGVLAAAVNASVTVAGKADTDADGEKLQLTPAGMPLAGHESVTVPLNDPAPETTNATPPDVLPCPTLTLAGDGAPSAKSTTCSVTAASCVIVAESVPAPCTLKR
jgi:hypothetical protein